MKVALLPDANVAIDVTLGHLSPTVDQYGDGFTCRADLDAIDDPQKSIVRKALAGGAALGLVRPEEVYSADATGDAYEVHSEFYRLLARLRAESESGAASPLG